MKRRSDPLRRELVFGTVCGLGLSTLVWTLTLWPPPATAAAAAALVLGGVLGGLTLHPPRVGPVSLAFPAALALLLLQGAGAAVATAVVAAVVAALLPAADGRPAPDRIGHRAGARVIAIAAAAAVHASFGGGAPALAAGVLVWGAADNGLRRLECWAAGLPVPARPRPATVLRAAAALALGGGLAWSVAFVHERPDFRPWLLLLPAAALAALASRANPFLAGDLPAARRGCESATRALVRAIAVHDAGGSGTGGEERLWRVRDLCVAVGARLGLRESELRSLATAALLHDVGKIAVPAPLPTRTGSLSPAEMERVRIHPAAGAEILEAIAFPPAVGVMVRHHHERWDGRGYPDGLAGEAIPLGARILAAVDCYDAILSSRPRRRALPAAEARRHLRREAGAMFDPAVVDALAEHLDETGPSHRAAPARLAPAGAERSAAAASLPGAQRDLEHLYAVSRATRYPIDLDESLTLVAARVVAMVPARAFVVWRLSASGERLRVLHASGVGSARLRGVEVPLDERPVAWAVRHQRAIVGHDHLAPLGPARAGHARADLEDVLDDPELRRLCSSVVVPIACDGTTLGALALYDDDDRKFTREERRLLGGVAGYVARAMARQAHPLGGGQASLTDPLTGLPNARFLWLEAARQAAGAERAGRPFHDPYGVIAFRVGGLSDVVTRYGTEVAERGLVQIGRRLAAACTALETLVRYGPDLFLVLSPHRDAEPLVERWRLLLDAVESRPLDLPSAGEARLRLVAAHAACPADGDDLDALFEVLESRLDHGADERRTVVPFRRPALATADAAASARERPV